MTLCAARNGKVGCNTIKYTRAFLYSDWLYFLWHGINYDISGKGLSDNKQYWYIYLWNRNHKPDKQISSVWTLFPLILNRLLTRIIIFITTQFCFLRKLSSSFRLHETKAALNYDPENFFQSHSNRLNKICLKFQKQKTFKSPTTIMQYQVSFKNVNVLDYVVNLFKK